MSLHSPKIAVVHPSRSLIDALQRWADRCGTPRSVFAFEKNLSDLCERGYLPDLSIVDATEFPAKAVEDLARLVEAFGDERAAAYTEIMHRGLETSVRRLGVSLLLGPMSVLEWNGYFEGKFSSIEHATEGPVPAEDVLCE
jgi:hypothetical protein